MSLTESLSDFFDFRVTMSTMNTMTRMTYYNEYNGYSDYNDYRDSNLGLDLVEFSINSLKMGSLT